MPLSIEAAGGAQVTQGGSSPRAKMATDPETYESDDADDDNDDNEGVRLWRDVVGAMSS